MNHGTQGGWGVRLNFVTGFLTNSSQGTAGQDGRPPKTGPAAGMQTQEGPPPFGSFSIWNHTHTSSAGSDMQDSDGEGLCACADKALGSLHSLFHGEPHTALKNKIYSKNKITLQEISLSTFSRVTLAQKPSPAPGAGQPTREARSSRPVARSFPSRRKPAVEARSPPAATTSGPGSSELTARSRQTRTLSFPKASAVPTLPFCSRQEGEDCWGRNAATTWRPEAFCVTQSPARSRLRLSRRWLVCTPEPAG